MLLCLRYGCRGQDLRCSLHLRFACDCSSCILHGFGFAVHGIRPCHHRRVVRCSMLPDGPPQEKDYIGINTTGFLNLAVVVSFWIARFDRCRTDSPRDAPRLGASCGKIQPEPRQKLFERCNRINSEDNQAPTHRTPNNQRKHVSLFTISFARAPPPLEDIQYSKSLHHDDTVVFMEISSI